MNHIDSAIKARGAARKLKKTFGASKPVPGTYDDIVLSDAFLSGKLHTENPGAGIHASAGKGAFVEYFYELPEHADDMSGMEQDFLMTSYMFSLYENALPSVGLQLSEDKGGRDLVSTVFFLNLASAMRSGTPRKSGAKPMMRVRRCMRNGAVTYTVV